MAKEEIQKTVVVSDKDAHISRAIAAQGDKFPEIDVVSKKINIFKLPPECEPKQKLYGFRWMSKDSRMIDRNMAKGWKICTRILCPWIEGHRFSINGAVERYGHMLAFRPVQLSNAYKKLAQDKSNNAIKTATLEGVKDKEGSDFYTAKLSVKESDGEGKADDLVQDRDF